MLYKEDEQAMQERAQKAYENWPDFYYELADQNEREGLLSRAITDGIDIENNQLRMKVLKSRYQPATKREPQVDKYVKSWLTMFSIARAGDTFLNKKVNKKNLSEALQDLGVLQYNALDEKEKEIYQQEWKHFTEVYFRLCAESKDYQTVALGFGKLKDHSLVKKMANEIYMVFSKVPAMAGVTDECMKDFKQAVMYTFGLLFINGADELKNQFNE